MQRLALALPALLLPALPLHAQSVDAILAEAEAACASFENGTFAANDAVSEVELTGEAPPETIVDESRFTCSSAASMYCGSGGCMLHAIAGGQTYSWQAEGWRMIDWDGKPILLVARDGGWCGGAGSQLCFEAVNWSFDRLMSVIPIETGPLP